MKKLFLKLKAGSYILESNIQQKNKKQISGSALLTLVAKKFTTLFRIAIFCSFIKKRLRHMCIPKNFVFFCQNSFNEQLWTVTCKTV